MSIKIRLITEKIPGLFTLDYTITIFINILKRRLLIIAMSAVIFRSLIVFFS